ncbi:hypothetical protein E0H66_23045 [Rhizobium leguminosarum bv. viciae]|uniref:hypothetical protein n=1 Tax=Rhizobium leguminosarum TaxID=384 RepID=UPI00103D1DE4|nr:hypothetical protein [Rhizobium leguminosarum]MBY5610907.1 hypothetical protein [Rhizobium leguminosarum]TCA31998.1 hypothetical protein E0H66_23045 [Rhizobium leguminosarum bv. viciae]
MDSNEYLNQARRAGSSYGEKLGDKLAHQVSGACASREIAEAAIAAARQAAAGAIKDQSTAPFIEAEAAGAWRDAASAAVSQRMSPATNLALASVGADFPNRRDAIPAVTDFDVSVA